MSSEILQDIISKLKQLQCPVVANREDLWIEDLLFSSGNCKLQLLEWFVSEIYSGLCEESSLMLLNSPGEKRKHLLSSLYSLGFCKKDDHDLIKGHSKKTEQLYFWQMLTDVLWEKYETTEQLCGKSIPISSAISEACAKSCAALEQIVSTVSMKDLLVEDINLFPSDICEHAEEMISTPIAAQRMERLKIPLLEELKSQVGDKQNLMPVDEKALAVTPSLELCQSQYDAASEEERISIAKQMSSALNDLHDNCKKFNDAYLELQPVLKITEEEGTDSGPAFKRICEKMKLLQTFLSDVNMAKEASSYLEQSVPDDTLMNSDINLDLLGLDLEDYDLTIQGTLNRLEAEHEKELQKQ